MLDKDKPIKEKVENKTGISTRMWKISVVEDGEVVETEFCADIRESEIATLGSMPSKYKFLVIQERKDEIHRNIYEEHKSDCEIVCEVVEMVSVIDVDDGMFQTVNNHSEFFTNLAMNYYPDEMYGKVNDMVDQILREELVDRI
jgi:hypothetical protein